MDFNEYQKTVFEHAIYPNRGKNFVYPALGIAGEGGEVCDKIKKILRDKDGVISKEDKESLKKELGDIIWYISAECSELGLTLDEVISTNLDKMFGRRKRGTLHGSGDDR